MAPAHSHRLALRREASSRLSATPPAGPTVSYRYDQANRLVGVGDQTSYAYDGEHLRQSKTVAGVTTAFVWDLAEGLPLVLQDGADAYVYGPGGRPLEQVHG